MRMDFMNCPLILNFMESVPRSWERPLWRHQILVPVFMGGGSTFICLLVWWEGKGMDHFLPGKVFSLPFHSYFITCTILWWKQQQGKEKHVSPCNTLFILRWIPSRRISPLLLLLFYFYLVEESCLTPQLWGLWPTRLSPWDFPGRNTGVGCPLLLQGIFPSQDWTRVSCVSRWIPYHWATREASYSHLGELKRHSQSSPRKKQQNYFKSCVTFCTKQQSKSLWNLLGQSIWYLTFNWNLPKWSAIKM